MSSVGTADCRGPERPIAARRLSCSSVGVDPSRDISNASAAEMYLPTVSFDRPVPDATWRRLLPACQRRMTSDISTLSTAL